MSASQKSVRSATAPARTEARSQAADAGRRPATGLFVPGKNCTRLAHADHVSLIVDAEDYFRAFARAAEKAQHSVFIVGWDFHSRTRLHLEEDSSAPDLLGDFLNFLVKRRRALEIHVLIWDYPMIFSKGRELSPIYGFGWRPRRRVHVCYDDHYPIGAAQHQKIVTIDGGAMAFCGGLDLTRSRWDTSEHKPGDSRRVNFGEEEPYAPFHDTMMAMDGEAARALDEIVRARWERAIRRPLPKVTPRADVWPEKLPVTVKDVDVAIARTVAPMLNEKPVAEVEALYLDMIAAAKQSIYIENQYFTSNSLGDALAKRLREPDGPEIIAVMRLSTEGWLEAPSMGTLRTVLLRKLRDADAHGRFHPFYPNIPCLPEGQCCDLHSKLMIVDDEIVRIGSANFCNRSMGLDTECDVAIEAKGEARVAEVVRGFRNRLLAEHLGKSPEEVDAKHRELGSLSRTIEALKSEERSLLPYEHLDDPSEALIAFAGVADPEKPVPLDRLIEEFAPDTSTRPSVPPWLSVLGLVLAVGALAALWRYTPLAAWTDAAQVAEWAEAFSTSSWAPLLVMLAYTPAALVLFPRPLITLFAVLAFGVWGGFALAFAGVLVAAAITYFMGRKLNRGFVRRIAGSRLNRLSQAMRRRGLLAMTAIRLVPIAPFAVVNIVAGAIHVPLRHFILGSALGILPGTLVATVFGDQLADGLRNPASVNVWLIVAVAAVLAIATWGVRRWLFVARPETARPNDAAASSSTA
jgi:phospholipase D1/2